MTHLAQIPLESYLLAEQAAPIACLVCDHENCCSAARCRNCSAPMSLAHNSQSLKKRPHLIAVIGASGAGKTVYLGLLMDMLTRHIGLLRSTARGPMSISLQQTTTTALATGWFPEKTVTTPEHWHWVHCQFNCRRRRRPLELVIPDISGEALAVETERSGRYPAIRSLLAKCAGVMVLADAEPLQSGDHSQDFVALKLLSLIGELRNENAHSWRKRGAERRPLALVLTKADKCDGLDENPREFAESHAPALWNDCRSRFGRHEAFACSVAGATAYRESYGRRQQVPLRVEPRGIIEPFGWLMTELTRTGTTPAWPPDCAAGDANTVLNARLRKLRSMIMESGMSPKERGAGFGRPHHFWHQPEGQLDPIARMEWLDDLMFAAIDGDPVALDCVADAWRKSQDELGLSALEDSRQQYLRRAQTVWHTLRNEPNHPPHKVFAAIEIISLLAGKTR